MVVVFFQIVYPQKPHILSEKMVTAVHPFVPCATKATSSLTANTAIVVWFMGFGDAGPRPHRTGRIGNKGRATSFVGNSRNPSLEIDVCWLVFLKLCMMVISQKKSFFMYLCVDNSSVV